MITKITWVTPSFFIDVDIQIVPELSNAFCINWIITGSEKPKEYVSMEKLQNKNLKLEFYGLQKKWYLPISYFEQKRFFQYLKSKRGDIIYYDSAPQLFTYYAALKELPISSTVFATHNVKTPKGARYEKLAKYYMRQLLNNFQNFQTFSKNQRDFLNSLAKGKNVLYAPLALKDYGAKKKRQMPDNVVDFLSFGHIRDYKRIDLLIMAAQELFEEGIRNFQVTLAGNCTDWDKYAKMIRYPDIFNLKIGYVADEDIPQLFADANYLVLPYQDLAQSGAITVAFNYNVPVITSNIEQFREFVYEGVNGMLFQSESVENLKLVMKTALGFSKEEYHQLVLSTTKYVENNYSLKAIAKNYINYFNQL